MYSSPATELHLDPTSAGYERVKSNLPYHGDNLDVLYQSVTDESPDLGRFGDWTYPWRG